MPIIHDPKLRKVLAQAQRKSERKSAPAPSTLHERIAHALGWPLKDATSFSLPALRDLVRPVSPKLAAEITTEMDRYSGR
jgi:hypothetical protein